MNYLEPKKGCAKTAKSRYIYSSWKPVDLVLGGNVVRDLIF